MMAQAALQKVRRAVIDPMVRLYQLKPLDDYQIEAFVEELGGYSEESLDRAWRQVRRTCRSRPSIAHFVEALEEEIKPGSGVSNPQARGDYWCRYDRRLADRVLRSTAGQSALREGVGHSAWLYAFRDGEEITEAEVRKEKRAMFEVAEALAKLSARSDPFSVSLLRFWDAMKAREESLRASYLSNR